MKYYLSVVVEKEVTKEEYIRAENSAGFHSKLGPDEIATASFGNGKISGHVEYEEGDS